MITELAESRTGTHTDLKTTQKSARPARANLSPVGHPQTAAAAMLTELTVLQPACPWRPVDWRLQRAQLLAAGYSPEPFDDDVVRQTATYLRRLDSNTGGSLPAAFADIGAAHAFHIAADPTRRDELQAWLLSGLSFDAIAARTGIPAAVASAYNDICYDVLGHLNTAHDWIVLEALGIPRWPADGPRRGDIWKMLAYHGGPAILDLIIADDLGYPEPHYPDRLRLAAQARWLVREEWASHCADPAVHLRILEEGRALFSGSASSDEPADPKLDLMLQTVRLAAGPLSTLMPQKLPASRRRAPSDKQMAKAAQGFAAALRKSAIEKRGQAAAANAATGKLASAPEAVASWCLEAGFW